MLGEYEFKNLGNSKGFDVLLDDNGKFEEFNKKRYYEDSIKDIQSVILILNTLNNGYMKLFAVLNTDKESLPKN